MQRHSVSIRLEGKDYTLTSGESEEHLRRVADLAQRQLSETAARFPGLDREARCLAAVLSLTEELVRAQDENRRLRRRLARGAAEDVPGSN